MSDSRITRITGPAIVLRGDDIDTDRIIPARFLKAITFEGLEAHVFADERRAAGERGATHPFDDPTTQAARILLVNANFGCGSSREHAPQALARRGIRAVIGESFGEIFFSNSTAIGLPCLMAAKNDLARLMALAEAAPSTELTVDIAAARADAAEISVPLLIPPSEQHAFVSGEWDAAATLLENYEEVQRVGTMLPYARWHI